MLKNINFIEDIIKNILTKWDGIPLDMRGRIRDELMSVFISFVGENNKTFNDKQVIRIHQC